MQNGILSHYFNKVVKSLGTLLNRFGAHSHGRRRNEEIQMTALSNLFTGHPKAAGETYFEHMAFALSFSARLFKAALAALVHGFVPGICETTASQSVLKMNDELRARRALLTSVPGSTAVSR
jgi:hypothetical protein